MPELGVSHLRYSNPDSEEEPGNCASNRFVNVIGWFLLRGLNLGLAKVLALSLILASLAVARGGLGSLEGQGGRWRQELERQLVKHGEEENDHTLYAQVILAKNGVVGLSAGRLESASPWVRYLAPGMWIRAMGEWEDGVFRAHSLEVVQPAFFSYYKGPAAPIGLAGGWIEAWHASGSAGGAVHRLTTRPATPGGEVVLLVRWAEGRLAAFPLGLPPVVNLPQGWMLVKGTSDANGVRWTGVQHFP